MMTRLPAGLLALAMTLGLVGSIPDKAHAAEVVSLGTVGSGSALQWPLYIGVSKGYFEQEGVTIDFIATPSSAAVQQQVAAGSVNLGSSGFPDIIRAVDRGAPVSMLMVETRTGPYAMIAKPGTKSWADLKGATISIGGAADITRIYAESMLEPNGLKKGDYDFVYAGATSARFAALQAGAVQAAILTSPFNFLAEGSGFVNLGLTMDYGKAFPFTGYSMNTAWAKANPKAIQGFTAAYAKSVTYFYDPANKEEVLQILIARTKTAPADALKTYEFFNKLKLYNAEGEIAGSGIETLLGIMKDFGEIKGGTELSRFYSANLRKGG